MHDTSGASLVLVSDTSTEAERLIASLRVRGFKVRDVPLMLLPGRVEAQHPRLVICDGQVLRIAETVAKLRNGQWGKTVELLLLGIEPRVKDVIAPLVADLEGRTFARPIDVYSVIQRVEEIVGPVEHSSRPGARSMAALPRIGVPSAPATRAPTPAPRRGRSSIPQSAQHLDGMAAALNGDSPEQSSPRVPSVVPPSETSGPDSVMQGVPVARMSEELEQLLSDADRRLATGPMSLQPASMHGARLSPEQELDAILPPDVLAALDDPVDLDDEDETSHPAARQHRERPSSIAPRGTSPSVVEQSYAPKDDSSDLLSGGTAPVSDDTPVGRMGRGRFATASGGSEPPGGFLPGSILTPVPASVKTHHTHHTQANSSPQASAPEYGDSAFERDLTSSARHDAERRRRAESDSVVPGTNPEVDDADVEDAGAVREASSTAPPHPARPSATNLGHAWESLDDSPISLRRDFGANDEPAATDGGRRTESHASSTSPPARSRHLGRPNPSAPEANEPGRLSSAAADLPVDRERREIAAQERPNIDVPAALGPGDVLRALSRCVRSRYSGALAIEDEAGIRRVVMREGDFVMVASGIDNESLVAFLIQRGDLDSEAGRLARKLPQFGRHAGAALIAHGYLRQDELWPVLRAHAEWLLGRAVSVSQGSAGLEVDLPARLATEPAVFGGATGAEILVEVVRRIVPPEAAIQNLAGLRVRFNRGAMFRLLSECAMSSVEVQLVERAAGLTLEELLTRSPSADFASALYALRELGVLETLAPSLEAARDPRQVPARDGLDDAAVRQRVALRRGLVEEGDYFALLGISHEATGYEVRHAYLDLRREFEPSRLLTASTANLREDLDLVLEVLDEAYEILRDAARRERYRRALEAPPVVGNHRP